MYLLDDGKKRYVTDHDAFKQSNFNQKKITAPGDGQLKRIPDGEAIE